MEGNSRDIWVRDFGLIQTGNGIFKPLYRPNYLSTGDSTYIENGFLSWFQKLEIPFQNLNFTLDGGNFCHNGGNRAVITERIFSDNPTLSEATLRQIIAQQTGITEIAFVPEEAGDTTGHADGMVKWLAPDTIALNRYTNVAFRNQVIDRLNAAFSNLEIVLVPWNPTNRYWRSFADSTGVYVNALTTPNAIYIPMYGLGSDDAALAVFRQHADRRVIPVPVSPDIAIMGGAARCLCCQVYGEPTVDAKIPGAGRPVVKFKSPRRNSTVSRRSLITGIARDPTGIDEVRISDGNRSVRARYRTGSGKWSSRLPSRPRSNSRITLRAYAFDKDGSWTFKTQRYKVR